MKMIVHFFDDVGIHIFETSFDNVDFAPKIVKWNDGYYYCRSVKESVEIVAEYHEESFDDFSLSIEDKWSEPFVVDVGIPLPPRKMKHKMPSLPKCPFAEMRLGDSFLIPGNLTYSYAVRSMVTALFGDYLFTYFKYKKDQERPKIETRITDEGLRVWRVR